MNTGTNEPAPVPLKSNEINEMNDIETNTNGQETDNESNVKWYTKWQNWLKILILVIIVVFIVLAIVYNKVTGEILTGFLEWMEKNAAAGSFAFIGIYWFCTVMFIPGSLLTLGAGLVFRKIAGPV